MSHVHQWQSKPPEGDLWWSRSNEERCADEKDMAYNLGWSSPEEHQRLRLLLAEDPDFENSSDWPMVVEWCSSCTITREVKLVLPDEDGKVLEATVHDASTQTPQVKRRRRGGRGSRTRRMLAFQLMLTAKRGLPLSRILSQKEANNKSLRKDSAPSNPVKIEKEEKESFMHHTVKEERKEKEESCCRDKVSTGGSTSFTPRSFQSGASIPNSQPLLQHQPEMSPFSVPPPPLFNSPFPASFQTPQLCQMPAANWVFCGGCQRWGNVLPILVFQ